jgi:hypothetical protein
MARFIGIDGLLTLVNAHPEFDFLRYEPQSDRWRTVVSRDGEQHTGECSNYEARQKVKESAVWTAHREQMQKVTATRRAIESAFPEYEAPKG